MARLFSTDIVIPKVRAAAKPLFEDGWVCKLHKRNIISVRGRDSTQILQNITTTDMRRFDTPERAAVYSGLLTVKGKMMFDAIIAKPKLAF